MHAKKSSCSDVTNSIKILLTHIRRFTSQFYSENCAKAVKWMMRWCMKISLGLNAGTAKAKLAHTQCTFIVLFKELTEVEFSVKGKERQATVGEVTKKKKNTTWTCTITFQFYMKTIV